MVLCRILVVLWLILVVFHHILEINLSFWWFYMTFFTVLQSHLLAFPSHFQFYGSFWWFSFTFRGVISHFGGLKSHFNSFMPHFGGFKSLFYSFMSYFVGFQHIFVVLCLILEVFNTFLSFHVSFWSF